MIDRAMKIILSVLLTFCAYIVSDFKDVLEKNFQALSYNLEKMTDTVTEVNAAKMNDFSKIYAKRIDELAKEIQKLKETRREK